MISQQAYRPVSYASGNGYPEWPRGMAPMGTMQPQPMTGFPPQVSSGSPMTPTGTVVQVQTPQYEQSYIENILRLNLGKTGTFYMTYENNREWNAKIFKGILEAAGRDHIIISDPATGKRTILLMLNLDYATFDEPLLYQYPGVIGNPGASPVR
ncbi:spore coat protein GerQ [Paenibacillus sp. SEL1]|uniref:spore coat protein GerQ n=1 Tax=Paenibacillus TaxID=44249 RepID=UPI000FC2ECDE|nr:MULTISPECIES: spore coat protein GerQ [Paenibacillus]MCF2720318.1 spore coat protein GerQ [Paenibacillus sp. UKAQ_18]MCP3778625.1 spore coat protein GerQ [Paenibacillus sp. MZ03-122A]MCP3806265.1 spore coat protein GerQ [Paenibacillus sp. Lou8.1]MDY7991131.1 spore coat protein GerQ [Paenibacillus polymyxa]MDY8047347.1 spore coat protein GerQ [Paenibacillus polymyxa]